MHLYPRRQNVAAQVMEELKTVTLYATPPMEERRKKRKTYFQTAIFLTKALLKQSKTAGKTKVSPFIYA